ncbi:MAG: hypothetical protein U0797_06155 [Gemmataceae bacterium]
MLRRLIPVVVLSFAAGCGHGVAWRADSSGFLYTDKGGSRVVAFDLKTKSSRPVVTDAETKTFLPGLSPDGKRLAVARLEHPKGAKPRLQVRIYSTEGKEERRSTWSVREGDVSQADRLEEVYLYWTPQDRIILVAEGVCIYDVRQDRFLDVEKVTPWFPGASVLRPDGRGCLVHREIKGKGEIELLFLDWDGALRPLGKLSDQGQKGMTFLAEWDGNLALVMHDGQLFEADTAKGAMRVSKRKAPVLRSEGLLCAYHVFPGGTKAVCVYDREKGKGNEKHHYRAIELQDLATSSRTPLIDECHQCLMLYPSPDRKTVVLSYMPNGNQESRLLVVGADGKVVSNIKTGP